MNDEQALVIALSLTSTFAAGLAVEPATEPAPIARHRVVAIAIAGAVVLPLVAWLLHRTLALGAAGIGVLVASAVPGGSTGPLLAVAAGGDASTAARLFVVLSSLGTVGAIASIVALDAFDPRLVARASATATAASFVPLLLGLAVRRWWPRWADVLARPAARVGLALLIATVALLAVRYGEQAEVVVLLESTLIVLASLAPALLVHGRRQRIAVAQIGAVHNLALALLVLTALEAPPRATLAVLGYGLVMYVVTGLLAVLARARGVPR